MHSRLPGKQIDFRRRNQFVWPTGLLLVSLAAGLWAWRLSHRATCPSWTPIAQERLKSGDIVFIAGKTLRSTVVRFLELGKCDYTHVGMVVVEDGAPCVIHADPKQHRIVRELWSEIVNPDRIVSGAVYRINDYTGNAAATATATACSYLSKRLPFDDTFDLHAQDKLYCTALIWRAYLSAGVDLCPGALNSTDHYLLPSKLIESKAIHPVCVF